FLLDQKIDEIEFLQRIKVIALFFNSLSDSELIALKHWIRNTVEEELAKSAIEILEAKKEDVEKMVSNNAFILTEMKDKAIQEGVEKGKKDKAIEIAKSLLDVLDVKTIAIKTGLTIEEVENLK
ncbi:MAG: hypothetical protein ACRCXT_14220, partial [Paraclostridium sp.]